MTKRALQKAILENPDDFTGHIAYFDYLEEEEGELSALQYLLMNFVYIKCIAIGCATSNGARKRCEICHGTGYENGLLAKVLLQRQRELLGEKK